MKKKTTIHDIAKSLDITASTVSRALTNHPRISDATKKLVHREAAKLNYQPNHLAAALRNGKSRIIGIIVPTVNRSFFSSVVRGIEEVANKANYNVMICQSYDDYEKEVATVEALLSARVDGVITSYAKTTKTFAHFQKIIDKGLPLIFFDRTTKALEVSNVVLDDYQGAFQAVEHLINEGHKRIAHFTSSKKVSIYKERLRGYRDALKHYSIEIDKSLILESNLQLDDGRACMQKLLDSHVRPDAVFASSDYSIMGAMQLLQEKSINIPTEIALIGFGNEPFTSFTSPSLTTIDQHSLHMGNAAAELFFEQLKNTQGNSKMYKKIVLEPTLIIRQSTIGKIEEATSMI